MKNEKNSNAKIPFVRIGQGEYVRDLMPSDFDDPPSPDDGASVALVVLLIVFFVAGLVIGGLLW